MDWTATIALALLTKKATDLLRYVFAKDVNGIVTQLVVWVIGVIAMVLAAHTAWAAHLSLGGVTLAQMNFWSLVYVGLTVGSTSSIVQDAVKAVDNSDSAKIPALMSRSTRKQ